MDVSGGSTANGAVIHQGRHGGTNQQWTLHQFAGKRLHAHKRQQRHVPGRAGPLRTEGAQLDQGTCNGATNQQWALDPVGTYASSATRATN